MRAGAIILSVAVAAVLRASGLAAEGAERPALPVVRDARQQTFRFAACMYRAKPRTAEHLLQTPADDPAFLKAIERLQAEGWCLSMWSGLGSELDLIRGHLMEFAYFDRYRKLDVAALPRASPVDYLAEYHGVASATAEPRIALARFGECVVRANPEGARRVIVMRPASSGEAEALAMLRPHFAECLVEADPSYNDDAVLRLAIANGAYRLAREASLAEGKAD